jgi:release factor glutamine methyltransferase
MMQVKSWTIKELLSVSIDYLKEKHIDSPRLTAEVLLAFQLNLNRVKLYLNLDLPLNDSEVSGYRELIRRRVQREPLQYITGVQEFWSLDFQVDPRVLIPRPETELLVEEAKERIKDAPGTGGDPFRILDLGTGSGALAVTLAKEIQGARIWATDISPEAIELARLNAERHNISDRIEFCQGDLWHALNDSNITFDFIVSNPPYVSADEYDDLQPEVRDYEPRLALDGREQGLYYIQKIIEGCTNFLNPGGWLLLEMAPGQTETAVELMKATKTFEKETRIKDYSHLYRVVCAQKRGLK